MFDPVAGYRLTEPVGYWNGMGILAAMGVLLALGFAARARTISARAVSAALVVLLLPTVYFTFGRGPWIALGARPARRSRAGPAAAAADRRRA